jgi:serine/threonine-protein kinase RsbW
MGEDERMIRLNVPRSLDYRDLAMRLVAAACKLTQARRRSAEAEIWSPDPEFDNLVISAFGEAFNNAVLHGDRAGAATELGIEIEPLAGSITIRLLDDGSPFDFDGVAQPALDELPESGLGLFIIRSCMHEVSYRPGEPNVLTMTRYHARGRRS